MSEVKNSNEAKTTENIVLEEAGEKTKEQIERILTAPEITDKDNIREIRKKLRIKGLTPKPPKIKVLQGAIIDQLPPKLKAIVERSKTDEEFVNQLKIIIAEAVQRIQKSAMNQQTFCDYFAYPEGMVKKLLRLYGLSESELTTEMAKIGFHPSNRLLNQPYYQSLLIAYTIGLYLDENDIRLLALIPISTRIWNGKIKKSFPYGCDPDIARYVVNYMLRNNSHFKIYKTPYNYLIQYLVISVDKVFSVYVRQNPADPINGMKKIITTFEPRLGGLVTKTLAKHYYYAYEHGLKETSNETHTNKYSEGSELIEKRETIKNTIDALLDTYQKNRMLMKDPLISNDVKSKLKSKFALSDKAIEKINNWFKNEDHEDDLKMITEFILQGFEPKTAEEFCALNPDVMAKTIGNAKKNENLINVKKYRIEIFKQMFGREITNPINQTDYRILNIITYALILYIKKIICKKV